MRIIARAGLLGLLLVLLAPGTALANNKIKGHVAAGKLKATTCMGCHGVATYDMVYPTYNVPKLGGQHRQYIIKALHDYRDGKRDFPTMHAQASSLSDQDIADIAAFLSQQKKPIPKAKSKKDGDSDQ